MTRPRPHFTRTSDAERSALAGAFAPALLDPLEPSVPAPPPGGLGEAARALLAKPTTIRSAPGKREALHTLIPRGGDGTPAGASENLGAFLGRAEASLVASVLPAAAIENPFTVGDREPRRGYPVYQDGLLLGHVAHPDAELPARLHLAWTYATNLEAVAHLLEGLDTRALVFLGRVLARRLEEERGADRPSGG